MQNNVLIMNRLHQHKIFKFCLNSVQKLVIRIELTLRPIDDITDGSTQRAPWVLLRNVAKIVWISVQFSFVEYNGCFLGASYFYVLVAAEESTHNIW